MNRKRMKHVCVCEHKYAGTCISTSSREWEIDTIRRGDWKGMVAEGTQWEIKEKGEIATEQHNVHTINTLCQIFSLLPFVKSLWMSEYMLKKNCVLQLRLLQICRYTHIRSDHFPSFQQKLYFGLYFFSLSFNIICLAVNLSLSPHILYFSFNSDYLSIRLCINRVGWIFSWWCICICSINMFIQCMSAFNI